MKKEYVYKRGAKERVGSTHDTLFQLIAIDGGACEAMLIDNLSSMLQTECKPWYSDHFLLVSNINVKQ